MVTKTDDLIAELQKWCDAEHGRRAELARLLGTKRQTVSNWFSRKHNPTSEQTLQIIEFLENPEAQRKPGRGLKK
jgi:DNA-binding transcriptional regulator YiaG